MNKVLIADDHSLFSSGFAALIEQENDFEVVGRVDNGEDVLYQVISKDPDVLILDLNLPRKNGLTVLKEVKEYLQKLTVVVITMYNDEDLVKEVRKLGGSAYFLKNSDESEILDFLKSKQSKFYITKTIQLDKNGMMDNLVEDQFTSIVKLTTREIEILKWIAQGKSSREIAEILNISPSTVDTHRKNMLKKLEFKKMSELVSYAYRNNLV